MRPFYGSRSDAEREEHNAFCERYGFTKAAGRSRGSLVGPKELRAAMLKRLRESFLLKGRGLTKADRAAAVDRVMNDPKWLGKRTSYVLVRLLDDIEDEVFSRVIQSRA